MYFRVISLFVFLMLCQGLSPAMAQQKDAPESQAETALQRALKHYNDGKLNEAAGLLRGFIVSHSGTQLTNQAYYYLARIHKDLNDPTMAIEYLERVSGGGPNPEGLLLQSELFLQMGDSARVVDKLLNVETTDWSLPQRQEHALFLAEGLLAMDQPQRALYFLQQAMIIDGAESPRDVLARIYTLLSDRYSNHDLAEAAFMYKDSPTAYLSMLQLGWRALAAGQKELAKEWADAALEAPIGFAYREEALALQSQLADPTKLQRAIGVLLPLSGRYATFGQRVKRGIELAAEDYRPQIPVRFVFRDTQGDEAVAAQQLAELAISDRVMGVAGPLVGNAASGAVKRASQERIPLLTMSQRDGLAASSLYVFRNSLTPQLQVKALADHAIEVMGYSTFGILNPQTRQGEYFAELFRNEVWQRGAEIIAEQSYDSEQTDFRYQIRVLQGLDPNAPDEEEEDCEPEDLECLSKEEEPPPFEALFIPDDADRISLIAPQVPFYGLDGVQLLGTNGWNDEELPRVARQFVEGAIFTDSFFLRSDYPFIQDFVEKFFNRYGEEPSILDAQGYDIAGILLTLMNDSRVNSREDLRRALSRIQNFPGVTGATRFDLTGEADKVLYLLQVQNGTIVQIN